MNQKIVFIDIDSTLNIPDQKVSKRVIECLDNLKEKGILTVINTGRSLKYAINKSLEAHMSEYIVSSNGTEVYNYKDNQIIFQRSIPKSIVLDFYKFCKDNDLILIFNSFLNRYTNQKDYDYNDDKPIYIEDLQTIIDKPINQIVIMSKNYHKMLAMPQMIKNKFPSLNIISLSKSLFLKKPKKDGYYYCDIIYQNTSKGTGIVELLDYLQIDSSNAYAIGDNINDIAMFDVVGTGIAMGDAVDEVKSSANMITASVKEDGVAQILERLF